MNQFEKRVYLTELKSIQSSFRGLEGKKNKQIVFAITKSIFIPNTLSLS